MIELNIDSQVSGLYKLEVVKKDGSISSTGWFKNLITDVGMDRRATNTDYIAYCQVGSGSATPSYSDTQLSSRIAGSNTQYSSSSGVASSSPYYAYVIKTFSFAAGVATGNISEVGVGWATTGSLFSRALVVDGSGNPTSITVLSDEELRVTYQFRLYVPLNDVSGSVVLGGTTYNYTARASQATTSGTTAWSSVQAAETDSRTSYVAVYNGSIGGITSVPSGTSIVGATSQVADAYINGSFSVAQTTTWGSTLGNVSGGISAIKMVLGCGCYQFGFSPSIPKDNTKVLSLKITHSWGRA